MLCHCYSKLLNPDITRPPSLQFSIKFNFKTIFPLVQVQKTLVKITQQLQSHKKNQFQSQLISIFRFFCILLFSLSYHIFITFACLHATHFFHFTENNATHSHIDTPFTHTYRTSTQAKEKFSNNRKKKFLKLEHKRSF